MSRKIAFTLDISDVQNRTQQMDPELYKLMVGRAQSNAAAPHVSKKQRAKNRKGNRKNQDRQAIRESRYM